MPQRQKGPDITQTYLVKRLSYQANYIAHIINTTCVYNIRQYSLFRIKIIVDQIILAKNSLKSTFMLISLKTIG